MSVSLRAHLLSFQHGSIVLVVQLLSRVQLSETPRAAARQAPLSSTVSQSSLKSMSTESVMLSNHVVLCYPCLLSPSTFPSLRVFSNELAPCIRWPSIGASAQQQSHPTSYWAVQSVESRDTERRRQREAASFLTSPLKSHHFCLILPIGSKSPLSPRVERTRFSWQGCQRT